MKDIQYKSHISQEQKSYEEKKYMMNYLIYAIQS